MSCVWLYIVYIYNSIQHNGDVSPERTKCKTEADQERNNWTAKHGNNQINNKNDKEENVGRNRWAWSWWVDCWNASGSIFFNAIGPILKDDGLLDSWRWDRYVDPKRRQLTTDLRCVTFRKGGDLIYTAAGACNHARTVFCVS